MRFGRASYFSLAAGGVTNTVIAKPCPDRDAIEFYGNACVVRPGGENATSGTLGVGFPTPTLGNVLRIEGKLAQLEWRGCTGGPAADVTPIAVLEYFPGPPVLLESEAQPAVTGV